MLVGREFRRISFVGDWKKEVVKELKECCERLEEGSCERIEGVL